MNNIIKFNELSIKRYASSRHNRYNKQLQRLTAMTSFMYNPRDFLFEVIKLNFLFKVRPMPDAWRLSAKQLKNGRRKFKDQDVCELNMYLWMNHFQLQAEWR